MNNRLKYPLLMLCCLIFILSGCSTTSSYDFSALKQSNPRSIVIIPPQNNSVEVNAPYIFLSTLTRPLAEKGYYVFPVQVIDHFLKENGLPTPAEMNNIPLDKIREHIGADAVLYISIKDWGQKYQIISSTTIVHATLRLVDTKTGKMLWHATATARKSSDDGGGGLIGAAIGALITQVIASSFDHTPQLAKQASYWAISGLLAGPYRVAEDIKTAK